MRLDKNQFYFMSALLAGERLQPQDEEAQKCVSMLESCGFVWMNGAHWAVTGYGAAALVHNGYRGPLNLVQSKPNKTTKPINKWQGNRYADKRSND